MEEAAREHEEAATLVEMAMADIIGIAALDTVGKKKWVREGTFQTA